MRPAPAARQPAAAAPGSRPPVAGGRAARGRGREDAVLEEGALRLAEAEGAEGAETEEAEGREGPKQPKQPKPAKQPRRKEQGRPDAVLEEGPVARAQGEGGGREWPSRTRRAPRRSRPRQPFWKQDARRSSDAPKAERQAKREEASAKPPIWKRDVSLRKREARTAVATKGNDKLQARRAQGRRLADRGRARAQQRRRPSSSRSRARPLERGIVVGGELRDPDALAETLKTFFRKHKLPKRGVRLGIANNRIGVRTFDVAGIDDPKQLDERDPVPRAGGAADPDRRGRARLPGPERVRRRRGPAGQAACCSSSPTASSSTATSTPARRPASGSSGIDLEAFALLRALVRRRRRAPGTTGAVVAVAIGHDRSTFAVSDGAICEFTRVLDWGGARSTSPIARALDLTPSRGGADQAAALARRRARAIRQGSPRSRPTRRAEAVRAQLQTFARELVSSLQFYQNQPGSLGIGEIVVTGGTAHLPGLAAELQRLIGVLVRVGDPLGRVKVAQAGRRARPDRLARRRDRTGDRGLDARRQPAPRGRPRRPQDAEPARARRRAARRARDALRSRPRS